MLDILLAGGWPMLPIVLCSAIMLAIVLEKFWSLRHDTVLPPGLGEQVRRWARSTRLEEKHLRTLAAGSPLGELFAEALAVRDRPHAVIKERIEDAGRHVVQRMEKYLSALGTIALIGPLLGLLGTVIGLIDMFLAVMVSGVGDPMKMAGGIGQALTCTAAGLIVAIPAYILHRHFRSRVTGYCIEMEKEASRLLDELARPSSEPVPPIATQSSPVAGATAAAASRSKPAQSSRRSTRAPTA